MITALAGHQRASGTTSTSTSVGVCWMSLNSATPSVARIT
jgi:hypothetical protein